MALASLLHTLWAGLNRGIGAAQRVAGRILFVILVVVALAFLVPLISGPPKAQIPDNGVLYWQPVGRLVEESQRYDPREAISNAVTGERPTKTIELREVLRGLNAAAEDEAIQALVIDLNRFSGGTPSAVHEVADAVARVRAAGKTVIAHAELMSQSDYLIASEANEIWIHPQGGLTVRGYGVYRTYFAELLNTLEVTVNVFRVGEFKSAIEPFVEDAMSPEASEANLELMTVLWDAYTTRVENAREGVERGDLQRFIDRLPATLRTNGGDFAGAAVDAGLVDAALGRGEIQDQLNARFDAGEGQRFERISLAGYLGQLDAEQSRDSKVAVITTAGEIVFGRGDGGVTGGSEHASLVRRARLDDDVKAIVLRVDSPGGSAFASELIREELALAKADGKPVVVSMGGLAASGGYWIATPADEIWATPTTITGSIGVFAILPTFERLGERYGVRTDGVGTTRLSEGTSFVSGIPDAERTLIQSGIENTYDTFLLLVAESRNQTPEQVDTIAQGRVWAGSTAVELGLVDRLGSLDDAIASAAGRAGLAEDDYSVRHYFNEHTRWEAFSEFIGVRAGAYVSEAVPAPLASFATMLRHDLDWLASLNDPMDRYLVCVSCQAMSLGLED